MAEETEVAAEPESPEAEGAPNAEDENLLALAAEVDAELEAKGKEEEETKAPPEAPKRSDALQRIIDEMYQGDENAFYSGFRERDNQMAKMARKVEELTSALSKSSETTEAEDKKAVAEHPDVKWVDEEMQSLAGDYQTITARQAELKKEYDDLFAKTNKLDGKYEAADDIDKSNIRAELVEARVALRGVTSEFNDNVRRLKSAERQYKDLQRRKEIAEKEALAERRQSRLRESESQEVQRVSGEQFSTTLQSEVQRFGVDYGSPLYKQIFHSVKSQLLEYMGSLPDGSPGVDIPEATKKLVEDTVSALNLSPKKQFTQTSKEKAQTRTITTKPIAPVIRESKTSTTQQITPEFAKERARKILLGANRS